MWREGRERNLCNAKHSRRRNVIDLITLIDRLDQYPRYESKRLQEHNYLICMQSLATGSGSIWVGILPPDVAIRRHSCSTGALKSLPVVVAGDERWGGTGGMIASELEANCFEEDLLSATTLGCTSSTAKSYSHFARSWALSTAAAHRKPAEQYEGGSALSSAAKY